MLQSDCYESQHEDPDIQSPPEFRPILEGRLFTAHDAIVDANCEVHPVPRLLYDTLPQYYRDVFKNCPMYLEKHLEFVKYRQFLSFANLEKVGTEGLRLLEVRIPAAKGEKEHQSGVVGCDFKDTPQCLYTHLKQLKHTGLSMVTSQYCKGTFNSRHLERTVPDEGGSVMTTDTPYVGTERRHEILVMAGKDAKRVHYRIPHVRRQSMLQQRENAPLGDLEQTDLNGQVVIPDYRLPKFGRASLVYCGTWRGKQVAVKILKAQKRTAMATKWETGMRKEIRLATSTWATLRHPNILPFYGYSDDFGDFGAFISSWCDRGTSQDYFESRDVSLYERLRLTQGLCEGLQYLHRLSLIHGDLKPMNVLIDDDGVSRISDFGLCTLSHHQELGELTRTTVHDGPERYMAPELFASADDSPFVLTFEGDIYSLGCVALEFIEGLCPFQRFSNGPDVVDAILSRLPPALRSESKSESTAATGILWDLLGACWSSQPSSRPSIAAVTTSMAALELIRFDDDATVTENTFPDGTGGLTPPPPGHPGAPPPNHRLQIGHS